jgi:poly-gamma-glutamate synthesis protein (capsule biosynthesis protein)
VDRRRFLIRSLSAATALLLPRPGRAQASRDSASAAPPESGPTIPSRGMSVAGPIVTLAAGGDTTLGYNLQDHFDQQVALGVAKEQLWPLYFAGIRPVLEAADIAVVNLECPFTERGEKLEKNFNFRARPELVKVLEAGSVDAVTLANNHLADWGADGVQDTIHTLGHAGIAHFGAGMNLRQARRPAVLERHGLKVGFLGWYFQADPDMLEPEAVYATRHRAGVAGCYKDLECVKKMIREDLESLAPKVDFMVPFLHWGHEGSYEVRDYQIDLAHLCVDLGAKAVLGSHPHRVQGIEVYRGSPVFYSLGNFVYGGIKEPQDTLTMIARISLSRGPTAAEVVPVQFTRWPDAPFQPFVLEGGAGDDALARIAERSRSFSETLPQLAPYHDRPVTAPADSLAGAR